MRIGWGMAIAALIGAGCSDPSFEVVFEVPPVYREDIRNVQASLLRPGASAFDCDALAFGLVSPEALRLSLDRQLGVTPGSDSVLADVDRTGAKVVLAEGLDADGQVLVSGCSSFGEIERTEVYTIVAEPVPQLDVVAGSTLTVDIGSPLAPTVSVMLRDARGRPLPGLAVRWEVVGVAGRAGVGEVLTGADGGARLAIAAPTRAGPFTVVLRARWAPARRLDGFVRATPLVHRLSGAALDHRSGRIGPTGQLGVVSLIQEADARYRVLRLHAGGPQGGLVESMSGPIVGTDAVLGLITPPDGAAARPIVVTNNGWWEIPADGVPIERQGYLPPGRPNTEPRRLLPFTPCGGGEPQLLGVYGTGLLLVHDAEGQRVLTFGEPLDVVAAGCVGNAIGEDVRTLIVDEAGVGLRLVAETMPMSFLVRDWVAVRVGMSFTEPLAGTPRTLIGTQIDVNDFVVSRARFAVAPDRFDILTDGTDAPPELPLLTLGGDLDGDGALDLVSLYQSFRVEGPEPYGVWVVLDRGEDRLQGAAELIGGPGATGFVDPQLLLVDIDGNGRHDILVAERSSGTGRASQVVVYPM